MALAAAATFLVVGLGLSLILDGGEAPPERSGPITDVGVASVFSRDASGAARAAARYTELFGVELALDEARARAVLDRVATPSFAEQQLAAMADLRGPIRTAASRPSELAAVSRAAATEVQRFEGETATVRIVSLAAIGARGGPTKLSLTEQRMDLEWDDGSWRAAGLDGPSREIVAARSIAAADDLRRALEGTDAQP